jgi:drug/metabolite transporter (DMT)-like permease
MKIRTGGPVPPGAALIVAVLAISWAAPLVRFTVAPALVISAWRLVFSSAMVGGVLVARRPQEPAPRLERTDWYLAVLAGACLGGHFWSWVAAVQTTTVASASVLVSLQPVFVAGLSIAFLGERPVRREWAGIGLAVMGAVVVGWGDLALGGQALLGDALALLGGLLMAIYLVVGRSLRQRLDLWRYVGLVYGTAAMLLVLLVLALPEVRLTGYEARDWLVFLAMAAGPMMLGHTGMNYAVKYVSAYLVNLAALAEPVGATLIAWLLPAIGEVPSGRTIVGGLAILGGIAVGLSGPLKQPAGDERRAG